MGDNSGSWGGGLAAMAPLAVEAGGGKGLARGLDGTAGGERWGHFDSSVNAVSFGFVATAILIAMFLVMAIFERFLRPRPGPPLHSSPPGRAWPHSPWSRRPGGRGADLEAGAPPHGDDRHQHPPQESFARKLDCPSPKMPVYARGVSVLMPGQDIPTFIAHPAPAACPPERITWPTHQ